VTYLFSCRLITTRTLSPPSNVFIQSSLPIRPRKNKSHSGVTPWMVSPRAVRPPPSDATKKNLPYGPNQAGRKRLLFLLLWQQDKFGPKEPFPGSWMLQSDLHHQNYDA